MLTHSPQYYHLIMNINVWTPIFVSPGQNSASYFIKLAFRRSAISLRLGSRSDILSSPLKLTKNPSPPNHTYPSRCPTLCSAAVTHYP